MIRHATQISDKNASFAITMLAFGSFLLTGHIPAAWLIAFDIVLIVAVVVLLGRFMRRLLKRK